MAEWIRTINSVYNGYAVHEVKCPYCGSKVTYNGDNLPTACYVCDRKLGTPRE